jgi:hypothetical protein
VSELDGETFISSHFDTITLESGNFHFRIRDHFLLDLNEICLVRHFGKDEDIGIPDEIETIGHHSFSSSEFLRSVSFGAGSRLRLIAFGAFDSSGLCSITIPSSVEEIEPQVFCCCERLSRVTFEAKSNLRRIRSRAFLGCSALESFCIPSSVELIGEYCFFGCEHISSLSFENPSHLRALVGLPVKSVRWVDIPDSVEVLDARTRMDWRSERLALNFGEGSKLNRITLLPIYAYLRAPRPVIRAFVRIPAHRLKVLRYRDEFSPFGRYMV